MAITSITFGTCGGLDVRDNRATVLRSRVTENITPSATSQQTTNVAIAHSSGAVEVCHIVTSGSVYVLRGSDPTVSASNGILMLANGELDLFLDAGDKIAVIEATLS